MSQRANSHNVEGHQSLSGLFHEEIKGTGEGTMRKYNKQEGKIIATVRCIQDNRQTRIPIPEHLVEMLGIKPGDKFNWYVKRTKERISFRLIFIKYGPGQKYFVNKNIIRNIKRWRKK